MNMTGMDDFINICHVQQIDNIDIFFVFKQSGLLNFKWSMNYHHNGRKLYKVTLFHVNACSMFGRQFMECERTKMFRKQPV